MVRKVLVTGGAGFIGHHLVEHLMREGHEITVLDRLDTSGNLNRLEEIGARKRCRFVYHDLKAPVSSQLASQLGEFDWILHLAAATHVDRSIEDPMSFVMDNVVGTTNLLDFARHAGCERFVHFSTDEVFGPAPQGVNYKEDDRYRSGNPYAASKAGAEEMVMAYANTFRVPAQVIHCMNAFGERQNPEKFIPMTILKVLRGEMLSIHADSKRETPGSRFYIHARNIASAVRFVLEEGSAGEKYNVVGEREVDNLTLAELIASIVGKPLHYELVDFHSSRPGHDLRYALSGKKLEYMGWTPPVNFHESLERSVRWTLDHRHWLSDVLPMRRFA